LREKFGFIFVSFDPPPVKSSGKTFTGFSSTSGKIRTLPDSLYSLFVQLQLGPFEISLIVDFGTMSYIDQPKRFILCFAPFFPLVK
jgi:hypothetical protein